MAQLSAVLSGSFFSGIKGKTWEQAVSDPQIRKQRTSWHPGVLLVQGHVGRRLLQRITHPSCLPIYNLENRAPVIPSPVCLLSIKRKRLIISSVALCFEISYFRPHFIHFLQTFTFYYSLSKIMIGAVV